MNELLLAGCSVAEVASITGQTYQVVEDYARKVNRTKLAEAAIIKLERKANVQADANQRGQRHEK